MSILENLNNNNRRQTGLKNRNINKTMESKPTSQETSTEPRLSGPILELQKVVQVNERYQKLFPQLLEIYQEMYDSKDKSLLFEIQPLAPFIRPEKAEGFKKIMDDIRNHLNVVVKNAQNCRQRLAALRTVFLKDEERQLINDALDLLNLPNSSEIQSDADFRLLSLQQFTKEMDVGIEIQEIFIYLNSLFQPIQQEQQPSQQRQNSNGKYQKKR